MNSIHRIIAFVLSILSLPGCATRVASSMTVEDVYARFGRGDDVAPPLHLPHNPASANQAYLLTMPIQKVQTEPRGTLTSPWPYSLWYGKIKNGVARWEIKRDVSGCFLSAGTLRVCSRNHELYIESSQEEVTRWAVATLGTTSLSKANIKVTEVLSGPIAGAMSQDGTRAWCSNIGETSNHKGFISEISFDGSVRVRIAFPCPEDPDIQEPKGLAVIGTNLWVIAHQRLVEYDIQSRRQKRTFNLAQTGLRDGYCLAPIGMISPKTHEYVLLGFDISDQTQDGVLSVKFPTSSDDPATFHASWDIPPHSGPSGIGAVVFFFPSFDLMVTESNNQCIRMVNMVGGFSLSDSFRLQFPKRQWVAVAVKNQRIIAAANDGSMWLLQPSGSVQFTDNLVHPGLFCISSDNLFALVPERELNCIVRVPVPHK